MKKKLKTLQYCRLGFHTWLHQRSWLVPQVRKGDLISEASWKDHWRCMDCGKDKFQVGEPLRSRWRCFFGGHSYRFWPTWYFNQKYDRWEPATHIICERCYKERKQNA